MQFEIGQVIEIPFLVDRIDGDSNGYEIQAIHKGGMGICFKVRNVVSGNFYALKTVQRQFFEDNDIWRMFLEEMKTWITVSACEGVSEAFCLTRINEVPFVCARWMEGGDLGSSAALITPHGFYVNAIRIARTMAWVHIKHDMIHRDLKPENILLDNDRHAYVTDWGLARPIAVADSGTTPQSSRPRINLTEAGQFKGTITYASPEQILGEQDIDHRSDIYSFGCILYFLETGRSPFAGGSAEEIAYKHLFEEPPPLIANSRFKADKVIYRCLAKDKNERFADWNSLAEALVILANKCNIHLEPFVPRLRYSIPKIGEDEFSNKLRKGELKHSTGDKGITILEEQDVMPFLKEAEILSDLGEWQKASDIYSRFFLPEIIEKFPDLPFHQTLVVNYGNTLIQLGESTKAISVFSSIARAPDKPDTYFVNLSLAYLHEHRPELAERTARSGIALYPNDKDLLGNLTIALIHQQRFDDALHFATQRLELSRDVHSLEELAVIHRSIADDLNDRDLPLAVEHLKTALDLLLEAKNQNPRFSTARLSLAKTLFDLRRYADAADELVDMLNNTTPHESVRELAVVKFAECLDAAERSRSCLDFCDKHIETFPNSTGLKRIRAQNLVDVFVIGNVQDGVRVVERSSLEFFETICNDETRRTPPDLCYLARLYEWMGKLNESLVLLEEAERMSPEFWEPPYDRGTIYWREGKFSEAIPELLRASELAPWRRQPWFVLTKIYENLGRSEDLKTAKSRMDELEEVLDKLYDANF
ncbi:MAG: protein kinase [Acidobacteria bacterium]|nr:protein kinase [Acidobacteriota bacterium]